MTAYRCPECGRDGTGSLRLHYNATLGRWCTGRYSDTRYRCAWCSAVLHGQVLAAAHMVTCAGHDDGWTLNDKLGAILSESLAARELIPLVPEFVAPEILAAAREAADRVESGGHDSTLPIESTDSTANQCAADSHAFAEVEP